MEINKFDVSQVGNGAVGYATEGIFYICEVDEFEQELGQIQFEGTEFGNSVQVFVEKDGEIFEIRYYTDDGYDSDDEVDDAKDYAELKERVEGICKRYGITTELKDFYS